MGAQHLKPWKPGQSGNPSGLPKLPDHLRGIASLTQIEVTKIVSKYARMKLIDLIASLESSETAALDLAIAKVFLKSIEQGDYQRLAFLLERAVGRVPVVTEDDADRAARKDLERLTDRELIQLVKEKLPALEKNNAGTDTTAG